MLKQELSKLKNVKAKYTPLILLVIYGIFVRFQGLGYSNLQGDEINPLEYLGNIKGSVPPIAEFGSFLLSRKRGPMQYIINYLNVSTFGGYINEFQVRFPFFLFSVLAFVTFYLLAKKIFDRWTGVWTVALISLNGLYIAFGRITQYQSFMYMTVPISILLFIYGIQKKKYLITALSGFLLSMNLLGHYDTLSTGPFFAGFLISYWLKDKKKFKYLFISALVFLMFFIIPALSFYLPYYVGDYFEENASSYLSGRTKWSEFVPLTPLIMKLLKMYMPIEGWLFTLVFIALGLFFIGKKLKEIEIFKISIPTNYIKILYFLSCIGFFIAVFSSYFYFKPRASTLLFYLSSIPLILITITNKNIKSSIAGLIFWFLFALNFYFFFMKDPRTHVYVVFIPGFILAGYGLSQFFKSINNMKLLKNISYTILILFFGYLSVFYWQIFADKSPEYPWWDKKVFGRTIYEIDRVSHKKIEGVFGFNNYRHWEEIRELYDRGCLIGSYNSNEKNGITSFYMGFDQTFPEENKFIFDADTLIGVEGPHSWEYDNLDAEKPGYNLLKTFENYGYTVSYIWGKVDAYPNGKLLCESIF